MAWELQVHGASIGDEPSRTDRPAARPSLQSHRSRAELAGRGRAARTRCGLARHDAIETPQARLRRRIKVT
jgi:hypothetical protein